MEITGTEKAGLMRAFIAAEAYGVSVEQFKQLKLQQTIEVDSEVAEKLIADGYAKEAQ